MPPTLSADGFTEMRVPSNFDVFGNMSEVLAFFERFKVHQRRHVPVMFDLSKIEVLTPEAVLYMLALFDLFPRLHGASAIRGNRPLSKQCDTILTESGFFNFVRTKVPPPTSSNSLVLKIETGTNVKPEVAQKVVRFAQEHLPSLPSATRRSTYELLIEAMANTKNHAYVGSRATRIPPSWRLVAMCDKSRNCVKFSFLDNGIGIPVSIRKDFAEQVRQQVAIGKIDGKLIESALRGKFRTRTLSKERGKGLPKIFEYQQTEQIKNLQILSNRGYVNCATSEVKNLSDKFFGTLLSWEFR